MNPSVATPHVASGPAGCGAVAAGSTAAAQAAAEILRAGGNAVDAALGATLVAGVAEPVFTSLGGGGFMLIREPDGRSTALDFFAETPGLGEPKNSSTAEFTPITVRFSGTDQVFHAGPGSVAVPGVLAGLLHASANFGRAPLSAVVEPAIRCGRDGTVLEPIHAAVLDLVREIMASTAECRELISVDGRYAVAGDTLHNTELAAFLTHLAAGQVPNMTAPLFSEPLLNLMSHTGGHVTAKDLQSYRVMERTPISVNRGRAQIQINPPPAFGGSIVAGALGELPEIDGGPSSWLAAAHALRSATAANRERQHRDSAAQVTKGTTHVSVVDFDGQVACITTSNGAGSGIVVPGTGIHLNNMMGEEDLNPAGFHVHPAGIRMSSMMAPTIVESDDGTLTGLGTGGSERIRSALLATLLRIVDLRQPIDQAIGAPRLHPELGRIQLEPDWGPEVVDAFAAVGDVNTWPGPNLFFGGVHAVTRRPDGSVLAAADGRRGGVALAVSPQPPLHRSRGAA